MMAEKCKNCKGTGGIGNGVNHEFKPNRRNTDSCIFVTRFEPSTMWDNDYCRKPKSDHNTRCPDCNGTGKPIDGKDGKGDENVQ